MDDMLAELEAELFSAKKEMHSFKSAMKSHLSSISTQAESKTYENVVKTGPKVAFSKAPRFKEQKTLSDSLFGASVMSEAAPQEFITAAAYSAIKPSKPSVVIPKQKRFKETKVPEYANADYTPKIDAVKRRSAQPTIAPEPKKKHTPLEQQLLQSGLTEAELETQASMSQVGPGQYNLNYEQVDTRKAVGFGKDQRFKDAKPDEKSDITPEYAAVLPKPPTATIAAVPQRSRQLQERDRIAEMEEEARLELYLQRPLDLDSAVKVNAPSVVIMKSFKEISAAAGSKHRRYLMMKLLDDLKYQALGPGAYETHQPRAAPCTAIYRPHSAEGRRVPPDDRPVPGPDYYYSKDDLIRTKAVEHKFGKEPRYKKIRKEDLDMRKALDINDNLVHPSAPQITIAPEKEAFSRVPNEELAIRERLGPGTYQPSNKLVEPRTDKGAVRLPELNEYNERAVVIDPVGKDREFHDYAEELKPSLEAVKPHVPAFGYHEPTEQKPMHVPDTEIFPEKWQHYDVNLDAAKERVGQTVPHFGGRAGRGLVEFLRYQQHLDDFKSYLQRMDNQPEVGQYDVNYKRLDKEPKAVDFDRYVGKDIYPIEKKEGFVAGDNLLLNPHLLPQHFPDVDFGKQLERPQGPQPKQGPELHLEPNIAAIKPRVKQIPNFEKQLDRPEPPQPKDTELMVEPQFVQVQPRLKGHVDFEKQIDRDDDPRFVHKVDERPLVVEVNEAPVKPKKKCLVKIGPGYKPKK